MMHGVTLLTPGVLAGLSADHQRFHASLVETLNRNHATMERLVEEDASAEKIAEQISARDIIADSIRTLPSKMVQITPGKPTRLVSALPTAADLRLLSPPPTHAAAAAGGSGDSRKRSAASSQSADKRQRMETEGAAAAGEYE